MRYRTRLAVEGFKAGVLVRPASAVYSMRLHNVTAVNCVTNNIVLTCPMREAPTPEDRERMPEMFDDEEKCVWWRREERERKIVISCVPRM